jgi:hypothetical protein
VIDQWLHFGISPSLFFTELFRDPRLLTAIDRWYSWWLPIQLAAIAFYSASPDNLFRRQFVYSQIMIWHPLRRFLSTLKVKEACWE